MAWDNRDRKGHKAMDKYKIGEVYQVSDYSGLDSRRIGIVIPYNHKQFLSIPGLYKPFDHKREVMLTDFDGNVFTMFKSRLHYLANNYLTWTTNDNPANVKI